MIFYRVKAGPDKGKQRRMTIGRYPVTKLSEARDEARGLLRAAAAGGDPAKEKQDAKKAPSVEQAGRAEPGTFGEVVAKFVSERIEPNCGAKHTAETKRILNCYVKPVWGHLGMREISDVHADELIKNIARDNGPIIANRVLGCLGNLFKWCLAPPRRYVDKSPVAYISKPSKEHDRDRTLNEKELKALWKAADNLGYPHGAVVKLLILTGQRNREVTGMKRPDIDFEKAVWNLTRARTKSSRATDIPLSPLMFEILEGIPKFTGPHIFTSRDGEKPIVLGDKIKKEIDKMLGDTVQEPWRFHDLRRTLSSNLAMLKVPEAVTEKILNHGPKKAGSVAAIYNRYEYADEKRAALAAYSRYIAALLDDRSHDEARQVAEERYIAELYPSTEDDGKVVRLPR